MTNSQTKQERIAECEEMIVTWQITVDDLELGYTAMEKEDDYVARGNNVEYIKTHNENKLDLDDKVNHANGTLSYWQAELATAQAMPDEMAGTISMIDFLKREMADSEVEFEIDNDYRRKTVLELSVNEDAFICDVTVSIDKKTQEVAISNQVLPHGVSVNYVQVYGSLILLAATIAQKWQAHCEAVS